VKPVKVNYRKMNQLYQIEKLGENNYDVWCVQMKSVLILEGLWSVVTSEAKTEDDNWMELNDKALATIILGVKASLLVHIKSCKTAAEAWKELKDLFYPVGLLGKIMLFKKLTNMRMIENGDMSVHLTNFVNTIDQMGEIGKKMPAEFITTILLLSLPKEYENFVKSVETRDELPTLSLLKAELLKEWITKKQERNETQLQKGQQQHARAHFTNRQQQKEYNNGKCYGCQKRGHFIANCPLLRVKNSRARREDNAHLS